MRSLDVGRSRPVPRHWFGLSPKLPFGRTLPAFRGQLPFERAIGKCCSQLFALLLHSFSLFDATRESGINQIL